MSKTQPTYTFFSWFRRGLSTQIERADPLGAQDSPKTRVQIDLQVNIRSRGNTLTAIPQTLNLYGPGDIIGLDRRAVIKTEPREGIKTFESNYLPYIEFYDEDFPWRYTPASPNGNRLRPWLALIVLEDAEFEHLGLTNARLPAIHIPEGAITGPFSPPDQLWAWAHAHINMGLASAQGGTNPDAKVKELLDQSPNVGCSRILCPRKLKPRTTYTAFLIPAFEQGRLAGLGADAKRITSVGTLQSSWGDAHTWQPDQWPVYYEWSFRTGPAGDFESLVRKIQPRKELDPRIGQRPIDVQSPGYGLHYEGGEGNRQSVLMLEGALRLPGNKRVPLPQSEEPAAKVFVQDLVSLINLDEDLKDRTVQGRFAKNPFYPDDPERTMYDDPIITPPFYGKHHTRQKRVEANSRWYNQLNLDPTYRFVAGLGTETVQQDQEAYIERAWQQFGSLFDANQRIRRQQLSLELSKALYRKHFKSPKLSVPNLSVMTSLVHNKVKSGGQTISGTIRESPACTSAFAHPLYTKMTCQRGPLMRRVRSRKKIIPFTQKQSTETWTNWRVLGANAYQATTVTQAAVFFKAAIASSSPQAPQVFQDHFQRGKPSSSVGEAGINLLKLNTDVLTTLEPGKRIKARLRATINRQLDSKTRASDETSQIMAAPTFPEPMYVKLADLSTDYLLPNLDRIPQNSFCLFENNESFIEAYLLGLNHEMARELLWREYPTDQRGTYFQQFWDVGDNLTTPTLDIMPIHQWPLHTSLGDKSHEPGNLESELVFTIRAELLQKYPNTIVCMQRAIWKSQDQGTRTISQAKEDMIFPLFHAQIDPDISFFGFNKTIEQARGDQEDPGWFFILKERGGELRFGLDLEKAAAQDNWDNLSWQDFPNLVDYMDFERNVLEDVEREGIVWGKGVGAVAGDPAVGNGNAADMAWILLQKPFLVAIHSSELLK
ncbi:MAG: hypothetical protein GKS05_12245 [Nitrospirales bacterium]|nr:hypothetical protein [Nitrospirales bacterium]